MHTHEYNSGLTQCCIWHQWIMPCMRSRPSDFSNLCTNHSLCCGHRAQLAWTVCMFVCMYVSFCTWTSLVYAHTHRTHTANSVLALVMHFAFKLNPNPRASERFFFLNPKNRQKKKIQFFFGTGGSKKLKRKHLKTKIDVCSLEKNIEKELKKHI
jgi:hypothetical protein